MRLDKGEENHARKAYSQGSVRTMGLKKREEPTAGQSIMSKGREQQGNTFKTRSSMRRDANISPRSPAQPQELEADSSQPMPARREEKAGKGEERGARAELEEGG